MKRKNRQIYVLGIPCNLQTPRARKALRFVLMQIRKKRPSDYSRLQKLVIGINGAVWSDGTLGMVSPSNDDDDAPRTVNVKEDQSELELIAVLAHEFGHVCSTWEDCEQRTRMDSEWASELAADWYAYKWGFGRYIARTRKNSCFLHHGPGPGKWVELQIRDWNTGERHWQRYRVTRNFRFVKDNRSEKSRVIARMDRLPSKRRKSQPG